MMAHAPILTMCAPAAGPTSSSRRLDLPAAVAAPLLALSAFRSALPDRTIAIKPRRLRQHAVAIAAGVDVALFRDVGAAALVLGGGYALVSTFDSLTRRRIIEQNLSRKLVHILSGLLFLASWPIFSTSTGARYFALLVPSLNCLRLVINGLSVTRDEGLITSVSREGKPEELLRGPLYYVLVLIFCAVVFWRDSPVGVISIAMMSGGDGIADIIGRRFGGVKIPYNPSKSWAGSMSMFVFGFLICVCMLYYFGALGYIQLEWRQTIERTVVVAFVATVVESLPISRVVDDNISVPLASMVTASLVFGH